MGKQLTTEEKIIQFLISEYNKESNNSNDISISKTDIEEIGISEAVASRTIQLLETSNLLKIKRKSIHNDFSMFWTLELKDSCVHFFDIQKESKIEKRNNWIQFWIPVIISIIALVVAVVTA